MLWQMIEKKKQDKIARMATSGDVLFKKKCAGPLK